MTTRSTSTRTAVPSRWGIRSACRARASSTTAAHELGRRRGRYALCTMCIGVGQGIAMIIERAA
ncbi:MAG: hypothetical protein U5K76_11190 [Woeseiaceae bacterium]|nr:hypothetical protein [Woeseiaceae bacterium]